jgi:NAD(P)-dependent dehydrogenase (short-subunit alcohol dehydrogenase family)
MRGMIKARYGRIINVTSVVGHAGNSGQVNYCAAKAGVAGMSRALARELASRNITVNCVAPGLIDTDMTRALDDKQKELLLGNVPLGRFGSARMSLPRLLFWLRRGLLMSPVRRCMSTAACSWAEQCRQPRLERGWL